jgi:hypothetical protein
MGGVPISGSATATDLPSDRLGRANANRERSGTDEVQRRRRGFELLRRRCLAVSERLRRPRRGPSRPLAIRAIRRGCRIRRARRRDRGAARGRRPISTFSRPPGAVVDRAPAEAISVLTARPDPAFRARAAPSSISGRGTTRAFAGLAAGRAPTRAIRAGSSLGRAARAPWGSRSRARARLPRGAVVELGPDHARGACLTLSWRARLPRLVAAGAPAHTIRARRRWVRVGVCAGETEEPRGGAPDLASANCAVPASVSGRRATRGSPRSHRRAPNCEGAGTEEAPRSSRRAIRHRPHAPHNAEYDTRDGSTNGPSALVGEQVEVAAP